MTAKLFGEDFLRRLELLRLALVRAGGSRAEGLRLTAGAGGTGEFREHRQYTLGDEPRYIDWNLYARLDKLFRKEFAPDREGRAVVLLDRSASMGAGPSGAAKFDFARRLAAAAAYVGLAGGDRVAALAFDAAEVQAVRPKPGPEGLAELLAFLERLRPAGGSGYRAAAARAADFAGGPGRGAALWISDFWTPPEAWADCAAPAARGLDTVLARVLAPEEVRPEPSGAAVLVDSETGERLAAAEVAAAAAGYERAAAAHAAELEDFAARRRLRLAAAVAGEDFEDAVLELLRRGRLVEPAGGR